MTKSKKCLTILLGVIMLFSITCFFVGCDKTDDSKNKVAVTAKIVAIRGGTKIGEWIFTPNVSEQYVEYDYTGEEIKLKAVQYRYDPTPLIYEVYDGRWQETGSYLGFSQDFLYYDAKGKQDLSITKLIEKGTYDVCFRLSSRNNAFKYRRIELKVVIK